MPEQKRLLVLADDDEVYTTTYGYFLEDLGFEVECVMDKRSLLDAAPRANVLVVDACLPSTESMEGIEAVAELLRDQKIRADVPVIFISGYREDTPMVRQKLQGYPALQGRYRWVWKDEEFELLSDAIGGELKRLKGD